MDYFLVITNACFAVYGLQMHGLLFFDHEVPLVVQEITLKSNVFQKGIWENESKWIFETPLMPHTVNDRK